MIIKLGLSVASMPKTRPVKNPHSISTNILSLELKLTHRETRLLMLKIFGGSIAKRRSIVEKRNMWPLFTIPCPKNQLSGILVFATRRARILLQSYRRKIIFAKSRNLSGVVNNCDFWDTDPVCYFTSLLQNVSSLA